MQTFKNPGLFSAGDLIISPDFEATGLEWSEFLMRHLVGDWEHMSFVDRVSNARAVESGEDVLSIFSVEGLKSSVGIITEGDRSSSFIFLIDPGSLDLG